MHFTKFELWRTKCFTDVAQQREHDRRVAEAAVAAARKEWERQQQQSPKQSATQAIPTQATTIIHSGRYCECKFRLDPR